MAATVLQLSDMHVSGAPGGLVYERDPVARLAGVLAAWQERGEHADLVALTGDNADDASPVAYEQLCTTLGGLDAPLLAIAGNHDDPAGVARAFGGADVVTVGAWRIIGIDSSRPNQIHGTVDVDATLERLDEMDDRPTVVAIHHPPVSPSTHEWFRLDGGVELLVGLSHRPHVRAVISGHLHEPFELDGPQGLALLGCPSTLIGFHHRGDSFDIAGPEVVTGARMLRLHDSGDFSTELLLVS